jgi:hypothetical protein
VRAIHHDNKPNTTPTLARKLQNQAKPLASDACTGSVMPPSDVNPVIANPKHMVANAIEKSAASLAEIFIVVVSCARAG